MMKRLMLYTVLGVCLFSACQQEELGEAGIATDTVGLRLTVSASDFVPADSAATRAFDDESVTTFEYGDKVGVSVLDGSGKLVANNLPYTFDGTNWNADGTALYYDPAAVNYTYILYYPYDAAANGATSIEALKALDAFAVQADQSSEEAYRQSDLMVWSTTASGTALEQINATLTHVRASYSLLPAVKMILDNTSQSAISYVPNSLGDVVFQDGNGEYIYPYRAEDGSFRYILPTDYKGTIRWFYSYEEKRYGGTWEPTTGVTANTRYSRVEVLKDFGEYTIDKAQLGDLYCRDAQGKGYLLPSEAASAGIDYECVGVVFALGHSQYDTSDYSATGIGQEKCHGYAVALSEAETNLFIGWGTRNTALDLYPEGVDNLNNPDQDWDGYLYTRKIVTHVGGEEMLKPMSGENEDGYPATYYAVVAYKNLVAAPTNSSGWFLPAIGQLLEVFRQGHFVTTVGDPLRSNAYYWSSSEDANRPAQYALRGYITEIKALQSDKWNPYSGGNGWVRSVLAF